MMLRLFFLTLQQCPANQGQDNSMMQKAPQFLLPSLAPFYSNTPGELGHQVMHIRLITLDTQTSVSTCQHADPKTLYGLASALVCL